MSTQRCGLSESSPLGEDVLAVEVDAARRRSRGRQEPHEREDHRRLAAPRLADQPDPLSRVELEADALDRVELAAALEVEPDVEVLDLQDRDGHSRLQCSLERPEPEAANREMPDAEARVEGVLDAHADHRAGEDDERDADAGRDDRPPGRR